MHSFSAVEAKQSLNYLRMARIVCCRASADCKFIIAKYYCENAKANDEYVDVECTVYLCTHKAAIELHIRRGKEGGRYIL